MATPKYYSPQLSRGLVSRLYHRAKAKRVPMTVLANQLLEKALRKQKRINAQRITENPQMTEPN